MLSGFILMYIAISCMTVYVLYAVSHSLWLFPMWLDAHQNPLSSLACNAQQNLSGSSIMPRDSFPCLSPFIYCSTAPIRLQVFPVPSKALQIESLQTPQMPRISLFGLMDISALRMPFVRSGTILSLAEVVSVIV